jgi:F0F1-type ATP synthase assembly protein I
MFDDFQEFFYLFFREPIFVALVLMLLIGLILAVTTIIRAAMPDDS